MAAAAKRKPFTLSLSGTERESMIAVKFEGTVLAHIEDITVAFENLDFYFRDYGIENYKIDVVEVPKEA